MIYLRRVSTRSFPLIAAFLVGFLLLQPSPVKAEVLSPREVRVGVAVSPGFKSIPDWKGTFERRLAYASKIFDTEFKIKFRVAVYQDWKPGDEKEGLSQLMEDLADSFPLRDVDCVIGLTRLTEFDKNNVNQIKDLHSIGQARPFGGYVVIRYPHNGLFKIQEDTVLVHELGHLFGAVHTNQRDTIMAPVVERQIPTRFDSENHEIILRTRTVNFKEGAKTLSRNVLNNLLNAYIGLARDDQSFDFFYSLGVFQLKLGQSQEALKSWTKAASLNDGNPLIHFELGMLYSVSAKYDGAIRELTKAVSGFRLPSQKKNKARALNALGEAYFEKNNSTAAYDAWIRGAAIEPNNLDIKANLAMVSLKRGQYDEAARILERILKVDPDNVKALSNLGFAYGHINRFQEALRYLDLALSKGRSSMGASQISQILRYRAEIYSKMKKPAEAFKDLEKSCNALPTVDCHKSLGLMYLEKKQWAASARELSGVLRYDKKDANVYGALGTALVQMGNTDNGLGVFKEGLKYAKDNKLAAQFYKNMGNILLNQRHFEAAGQQFQMAIAKDWNNADSHFGLALAYIGSKQAMSARETLKDVLRIDPKYPKAKEMLGKIEAGLDHSHPTG